LILLIETSDQWRESVFWGQFLLRILQARDLSCDFLVRTPDELLADHSLLTLFEPPEQVVDDREPLTDRVIP
jgi:hypothetical protein